VSRRRFKQDYKVHKSGNSDPMSQKKSNPDRVRARLALVSVALAPRLFGSTKLLWRACWGRQERKDVHKKIKSFFAQFKKGSTFDKIRSELQKEKRVADLDSDAADMRMSTSGASTAAYSSNQKVVGPHLPSLACCCTEHDRYMSCVSCVSSCVVSRYRWRGMWLVD
jgi:hypothetical protein